MPDEPKQIKQNKMGTMPVTKLVITMALPLMISMLVQALYNVIDSMYVSRIAGTALVPNMGDLCVNALTLVFPIQMLINALGLGTGVGVNSNISKHLGARDNERAYTVAGNAYMLYIIYYIVVALFGIFFSEAFLRSQTDDPTIIELGTEYLQIVAIGSIGILFYQLFEKLVQSTGKTTMAMIGQLTGAVTNIILDPILIFGRLGFPEMGIRGAAYATVIGQWLSCVVIIVIHFLKNKEIKNGLRYLKPKKSIIGEIYKIGVPSIFMQALSSVMTYGVNLILGAVSTASVTAFGIYYKLQSFIFMPVFGLNNAMVPIVAYNYGARLKKRIRSAMKSGLAIGCGIMLVGTILFLIIPRQIVNIYSLTEESAELAANCIRIIGTGFVLAGVSIILQGVSQALGNGVNSLIISLLRNIIAILPLTYLFSRILTNPEKSVWVAFPIAEILSVALAVILVTRLYRSKVSSMPDIPEANRQ